MRARPSSTAKSKTLTSNATKTVQETPEHARLKAVLREIITISGFSFDAEVALNFTGNRDPKGHLVAERSIDVAAYGSSQGKGYLLIFECKGGADIKEPHKKISAWEADIQKILDTKAKVVSSEEKSLGNTEFRKFKDIRVCYVFGKSIDRQKFQALASILRDRNFHAWDNGVLTYYTKTAATIGKAAKYQILRELDLSLESSGNYCEKAIDITQGDLEMFVFGAKPADLMKIAYVYRRACGKPSAYQRIINKDRIEKIFEFLSSRDALLPNAIIIAFDDEPDVQTEVVYKGGKLYFPRRYCSAWIIDGQHRIFGFLNTPFALDEEDSGRIFKVPVVAFKNLDLAQQNRTFVSINYNQKKIDPTLLCDLATELGDLKNELTWPSLLVCELNKLGPLKDKVRISELDKGKPITISSFARYGLLEGLLGYDKKKRTYNGSLNAYSPFRPKASVKARINRASLKNQSDLLRRYFSAVAENTSNPDASKDPWRNTKKYSLLNATGINALLLVLSRLLQKYPKAEADLHQELRTYLRPLRKVNLERVYVAEQGGGWKGFRKLANVILRKLNADNRESLRLFGTKDKK